MSGSCKKRRCRPRIRNCEKIASPASNNYDFGQHDICDLDDGDPNYLYADCSRQNCADRCYCDMPEIRRKRRKNKCPEEPACKMTKPLFGSQCKPILGSICNFLRLPKLSIKFPTTLSICSIRNFIKCVIALLNDPCNRRYLYLLGCLAALLGLGTAYFAGAKCQPIVRCLTWYEEAVGCDSTCEWP